VARVYTAQLLRVDLSLGEIAHVPIDEEALQTWLLGSGLAAHMFLDTLRQGRVPDDPLSPDNPLYAFTGLLTGTIAPTACRSSWCARSPLTGIWGESNMGGHWGAELRFAGYDGLVFEGGADRPVYLWIDGRDGTVELRDAAHLWGLDQFETHEQIRAETDERARIASIGLAGEHLVRYAAVLQGGRTHSRAAGRTGLGAVMGAKRLKAIALRGVGRPEYPDAKAFRRLVKRLNGWIRENAAGMSMLGTGGGIPSAEKFGDLALRNWQDGSWPDGAAQVSGQAMVDTIWTHHTFCHACPIGCGKAVAVREGPYAGVEGEGPEYEAMGGFGANLLIDDLAAVAYMNQLCNRLGLDTISTSGVLGFATEAMERGLIAPADADGAVLRWGDPAAAIEMIGKIAHREGLGDLLAEGTRRAARALGPETLPLAIHVKGLELPYHDPRAFFDMGLNYATAVRGACHLESLSYWPGYGMTWPGWYDGPRDRFEGGQVAAELVVQFQDYMSVFNPLGLCKFSAKGGLIPAQVAELVDTATGWGWDETKLLDAGRRIFDLKRRADLLLGVTRADDALPDRLVTEPRPSGGAEGTLPDMEAMLTAYYRLRGWDELGRPPESER
jgi:aldehyde:ferredoxin oxidoreductase